MKHKSLAARILSVVEKSKLPKEQITGRYFESLGIPHGSVGNTLSRLIEDGLLKKVSPKGMLPYYQRTAKPFEDLDRRQRLTSRQRETFAEALEGIPAPSLRSLMAELDDTDKSILVRRIRATVPLSFDQLVEVTGKTRPTIVARQRKLLARLNELKPTTRTKK